MGERAQDWRDVLRRLLEGDELALMEVNRLISNCLCSLQAADHADRWADFRQEVIERLLCKHFAGEIHNRAALPGVVFGLVQNVFAKHLRRHRRERVGDERDLAEVGPVQPVGPERSEREEQVWDAVVHLPERERRVMLAVYADDTRLDDVPAATGVPRGSVNRLLRRGREAVRRRVQEGETAGRGAGG